MSQRISEPADDALVDAHVHSISSDGVLTLRQLANLARRSGLSAVAVCDHDVVHDRIALDEASDSASVCFLSGVEITVSLGERTLHLLGYGFEPANAELRDACRRRQLQRRKRFQAMTAALGRKRVRLDSRKLDQIGKGLAPGRRHLARELVAARFATSIRNAFERHLSILEHGYIDDDPLTVDAAIAIVHRAGGKTSLAHPPANLTIGDWRFLVDAGLDAIEGDFVRTAKNHRRFLQERIAEYGLASTKGSDYHGDEPRDHLGGRTMSWAEWRSLLEKPNRTVRREAS